MKKTRSAASGLFVIFCRIEAFTDEKYLQPAKVISIEMMKGRKLNEQQFTKFHDWEQSFIEWIERAKANGNITSSLSSEEINRHVHSLIKGETFYPILMGVLENTREARLVAVDNLYRCFKEFFLSQGQI